MIKFRETNCPQNEFDQLVKAKAVKPVSKPKPLR